MFLDAIHMTIVANILLRWKSTYLKSNKIALLCKTILYIPDNVFHRSSKYSYLPCLTLNQQIWKTQQWPQDWKTSASIPFPRSEC